MIRQLRLTSGLILLSYVVTHFLNLALGLVSIEVMDQVLLRVYRFWANPSGSLLLYGAFAVHYALALWALWSRRTLRLPPIEAGQLILGLAIPPLLAEHVFLTRVADTFYESDSGYYAQVLLRFVGESPAAGALQFVILVIAWVHATIGLRFWLRSKPWYERAQPWLFAAALLLPTLAALGFLVGLRDVAALSQDPLWVARVMTEKPRPSADAMAALQSFIWLARGFFLGTVGLVLLARVARYRWMRRQGMVRVTYPSGRRVEASPGLSVLEISRIAGIPHAQVCGGRGRCSTCRISVEGDPDLLPPPQPDELRVLERIGAGANVRLACQLRPRGDIRVTPLLPATATARDVRRQLTYSQGAEREIVILFCDLRSFTEIAEGLLPYDVVFLLNRFFAEMGRAIEEAGGRIDKFIGDGIMALFGLESGADRGCREALDAAREMSERLLHVNRAFARDLRRDLKIGIGIHVGMAVVGEMGYGRAMSVTAIGDAVNTASRLEALCKPYRCELVVSEEVVQRAAILLGEATREEIEIRGRRNRLTICAVARASDLPAVLPP